MTSLFVFFKSINKEEKSRGNTDENEEEKRRSTRIYKNLFQLAF